MDPAETRVHKQITSNLEIDPGSLLQLDQTRLQVTVLRANGLPHRINPLSKKRHFYVTLTDGTTTTKTTAMYSEKQAVEWNEQLDPFDLRPSSRITLSLYAKRSRHEDQLIGTLDMPLESQNNTSFLLNNSPQIRLYLTINLAKNASSSMVLVGSQNTTSSGVDSTDPVIEVATLVPVAQDSAIPSPAARPHDQSLLIGEIPSGTSTQPTSDTQAESSNANVEKALQVAGNAVEEMNSYQSWEKAVGRVQWVMDVLSPIAELQPYAKIALSLLLVIPKTFLVQVQLDSKIKDLLEAIHDAFDFAKDASPLRNLKPKSSQANLLVLILGHVGNCCDFIQSYARDQNFWKRFLKNAGAAVDKQIGDLCSTFDDLRRSFLEHAALTTEISVFQILDDVGVLSAQVSGISSRLDKMTTRLSNQISDLDFDQKLGEIPYRTRWRSGLERNYLPGTRIEFLDHIAEWVNNPVSKRGLVLFGQAGTGKSSIAHEIARRFQAMNRLTSYFSFVRAEQTKREDYHLFTTIVRDLSQRYPSFKTALRKVIGDQSLRTAQQYEPLFESMLLRPLNDVHLVGPVFIIVDGLDESGDIIGQKGLHSFLAEHLDQLPSNFRVLITSRQETHLERQFENFGAAFDIVHMDDATLSAKTDHDVRLYLQENLPRNTFEKYGNQLAKKAEGVFQWVAVACGLINSPPPGLTRNDCVHALLAEHADLGQDLSPLNVLYKQVLEGYFESDLVLRRFRSVIGQLLAAFKPLSIESLAALRHYSGNEYDDDDPESVLAIVGHLGSLLSNVTSTDWTLPIVPLHTSFRDFLTDQKLSNRFYINLNEAHRQLAHSCLGLMLENLEFNICKLPSSYYPNDQIDDLQSRIDQHISFTLFYSCCFWDDHLGRVRYGRDLSVPVRTLFEEKFLFWLEVLSIKSSVGLATPALTSLSAWLASVQLSEDFREESITLQELVTDAGSFVRYFGMAIAKSAPHIYISALPFTPTSSRVARQYSFLFPNTLSVTRGQLSHWPATEVDIVSPSACPSVAFSPDGERIVSGSWDGTIRIWNATTGQLEGSPFTGHTDFVSSVAFSPDGQRIVSGSWDGTLRVWNASTGQKEGNPFVGHYDSVNSVAISPDGHRIVSGSRDRTICVWNANTGQMEGSPFTGHNGWVTSVAFSPDRLWIVSGSRDCSIRLWNANTGQIKGSPLSGHSDWVTSVAFSPDGQWIVSGSEDRTIRVWNAATGQMEGTPFIGHTDLVSSVAFSPDGRQIVSGSNDGTVRVWNARQTEDSLFTGHLKSVSCVAFSPDGQRIVSGSLDGFIRVWNAHTIGRPFSGHSDSVNSVAFSRDGQHIVSGSQDRTIRVWNASTGQTEGSPFTGHSDGVNSVAFSPDGQRIVSGSEDRSIRVWNVSEGRMEGSPFTGHNDRVNSVAFSPDGQLIVSGSNDCKIRVWNAGTGEMEGSPLTGHHNIVTSVTFSPNGQIVSGSSDGTIRLWNASTGEMEGGPFRTPYVLSIGFSPDGRRIVSGSQHGYIRVWNAVTGQMEDSRFSGQNDLVSSVAFSPDGQRIVSGSRDRTVRVWNADTGRMERSPLNGHTDLVSSVAFSPDGKKIVSGSYDHTIRLWNATMDDAQQQNPGFTDSSKIDRHGWILCGNSKDQLLLWIPYVHRLCLHRPSNVWIAGEHETRLDFSKFVHGREWASCYKK